jgi:Glutamine phosphoribosylpyrophosphate amidotransferase
VGLSTRSDSELITQALCLNPPDGERDGPDWPARITHLMKLTPLSYSLVIMEKDRVFAVRDPYGNRPLCIGKILPMKGSQSTGMKKIKLWNVIIAPPSGQKCIEYLNVISLLAFRDTYPIIRDFFFNRI